MDLRDIYFPKHLFQLSATNMSWVRGSPLVNKQTLKSSRQKIQCILHNKWKKFWKYALNRIWQGWNPWCLLIFIAWNLRHAKHNCIVAIFCVISHVPFLILRFWNTFHTFYYGCPITARSTHISIPSLVMSV